MKRKPKPRLLEAGDVIKTHPQAGFWGCAVVLKTRDRTDHFNPCCHIGITPIVLQHDYEWHELAGSAFSILEFDRGIRTAPDAYVSRHETCIGIYDARPHPELPVIGRVNPADVFSGPLGFAPGNATGGQWPLGGRILTHLGIEAVIVWRSIHDRTQWLSEVEASRKAHEALMMRLKNEEQRKRRP